MAEQRVIKVFWEDGTPDGIISASLFGWTGKIIKVPREKISQTANEELSLPGVYFLFCTDTKSINDAVYIGQADNIKTRLIGHINEYKAGKEKYYWQNAVILVSKELNRTYTLYLEDAMTKIARDSKRYDVLTKNTSKTPITAADVAMMNIFINNARILLSALNYKVLEPLENARINKNSSQQSLELKTKKANGIGFLTSEGQFAVMAGSKLSDETTIKCPEAALKARARAEKEGKVVNGITQEEIVFKSSSLAAAFLAGSSLSGPEYWKTKDGVSLKSIQKNNE